MSDPRAHYERAFEAHAVRRDDAARRSVRLSNRRAATFLAMGAAYVTFDVTEGMTALLSIGIGLLLLVSFTGQVVVHRRVRRLERWEGALASVAREGLLRLDRDWQALAASLPGGEGASERDDPEHPYARDLSVTGDASLVRLAGPVTSQRGRARLRGWLLSPSPIEATHARGKAMRELAPLPELRAEFTALGRLEAPPNLDPLDPFLEWAEGTAWSCTSMRLMAAAWVLPALSLTGIAGDLWLGLAPWWLVPALVQLEIMRRTMARIRVDFARCEAGGKPLRALVPQLDLVGERAWHDPLLDSLAHEIGSGPTSAHRRLADLSRLLDTVASRRNVLYAGIALLLLSDLHLHAALDRWRTKHGRGVRGWLDALGTWEALSALATIAHDHPDWADAELTAPDGEVRLEARSLGHPLLHPERCVRNDVTVGPPGTFLLVTGSNMSGKSTLLRAIGANAALAAAGAPVCADALVLPSVRIHTSMRIEDSLSEGVSLFMAELLRIKGIVDAGSDPDEAQLPVLYLLDEILHGTNSAERRVAARGIVRHLLNTRAVGAVSTHDLTLATAPDLERAAVPVHFREEVRHRVEGEPRTMLSFDYRLRGGIATTRNALALLDAVGLRGLDLGGVDGEGDGGSG